MGFSGANVIAMESKFKVKFTNFQWVCEKNFLGTLEKTNVPLFCIWAVRRAVSALFRCISLCPDLALVSHSKLSGACTYLIEIWKENFIETICTVRDIPKD